MSAPNVLVVKTAEVPHEVWYLRSKWREEPPRGCHPVVARKLDEQRTSVGEVPRRGTRLWYKKWRYQQQ